MPDPKPSPTGDVYPPIYVPTRTVLWWLYNLNGGVTIRGSGEHSRLTARRFIAPNHASHTDPPLIAITNQRRPVTIMAKEELFHIPVIGPYIRALGMFPVNRGSADRAALKIALDALANGRLLVIFPRRNARRWRHAPGTRARSRPHGDEIRRAGYPRLYSRHVENDAAR